MEIRNLVTFLKVTELNSFSKAAEALDYAAVLTLKTHKCIEQFRRKEHRARRLTVASIRCVLRATVPIRRHRADPAA